MKIILCNSVDFVLLDEVESINEENIPVLKSGKYWKEIRNVEKPVYQSNVKQNDAGAINEETVSVSIQSYHHNIIKFLIEYIGFHAILRMKTNDRIFYVGNLDYPCSIEYTSDKELYNYSFKAISPA